MVAVVSRALASHADCWQKVVSLSHSAPCPCLATRVELGEEVNMWGPCCPWAVPGSGSKYLPQSLLAGKRLGGGNWGSSQAAGGPHSRPRCCDKTYLDPKENLCVWGGELAERQRASSLPKETSWVCQRCSPHESCSDLIFLTW